MWTKINKFLLFLAIALSVFFSAWHVVHDSIIFHVDIARDFLLIENIVKVKPLTLIGPRSGGIPGVFHGPVWLYLNVPAFILGGGNPVAVGWFWLFLFIITLFIIYKVSFALFKNQEVALISCALFASANIPAVSQLFNPYGAVMLSPIFFYFYWQYIKSNKVINLLISLLILGFIIQFQMAFGGPLLILTLMSTIFLIIKTKTRKFSHLLSFIILIAPLSTFILFDLKHQFIQLKALGSFLSGTGSPGSYDFMGVLDDRIRRFFFEGPSIVVGGKWMMMTAFLSISFLALTKVFRSKKSTEKSLYGLFLYFYSGFWILTIAFRGEVWSYYYWPFAPILAIIFASFYFHVNKTLFYIVIFLCLFFNISSGKSMVFKAPTSIIEEGSSWKFYNQVAQEVYTDAHSEFGYYIFSPDLYGYSTRYAMNYTQSQFTKKKAYPFKKKNVTYLLIAVSTNPFAIAANWRKYDIKIDKKPVETFSYKSGFTVEKYILTDEEIAIPSNPYLIQDLTFR